MSEQITTPEALDARALMLARFAYGDHWIGLDLARRLDAVKRVRGGLAGIASRPDRPDDLAAEVDRLRAGIEGLDLDFLENVAFDIGHTIYEATELEPAECTDECNACFIEYTVARLRTLLTGREADR